MNTNTIHASVKFIALCDSNMNTVKNYLKTGCLLSDKDFIKQMQPEMAEDFPPPHKAETQLCHL